MEAIASVKYQACIIIIIIYIVGLGDYSWIVIANRNHNGCFLNYLINCDSTSIIELFAGNGTISGVTLCLHTDKTRCNNL